MSVSQDLGKVSVTPKGAWSSGTAYSILDIVTSGGGSYLAKLDVPAGTALSNTTYWMPIASKGDTGEAGTTTWSGITDKPASFPPSAHTHDDRYYTETEADTLLGGKQDTISDLSTIRSGASAGATAYQKPADGIPKTDLASGVQTSLSLADSALQSHQSLSAYRTASAQDVIDAGKQDAPIIKTALDSVLVAGVQYYLGLQSSLTLTLPTTGLSSGQMIEVVFYSNTTAATLNIVGDFLGSVPTISASTKAELNFLYDGTGWSLLSLITALTTYNITATVTNATASSSNPTKMNDLYSATLTFTFDGTSYTCPTTAPTITGATGTWTKNSDTQGTLVLSAPTGSVSFTVEGVAV